MNQTYFCVNQVYKFIVSIVYIKMRLRHPRYYHDEVWNTLSHLVGFILILVGGIYLSCTAYQLPAADFFAVLVYVCGAIFVYASSTAYHAVRPGNLKERLNQIDHISIYFMIAGSHMPIIIRYFNNSEGYLFLAVLWSLVALGIIFKIFFMNSSETLSLVLYVLMGCLSLYLFPDLMSMMPPTHLWLLIIGGLFYLIGIIFYCWESLPYNHPIWHLFVLAGSAAHFFAIYALVAG